MRQYHGLGTLGTKVLMMFLAILPATVQAQEDPTIMTVNGTPVSRSEFEYSFNKNNAEGVVDKKSVEEYVELFINYKLKVEAAKEARIDTMVSFQQEFASYRDQQIRPSFITDEDVEAEARKIYEETRLRIDTAGGMVKPAHILLLLNQKATPEQQQAAKVRIDSIYQALQNGADFADMARRFSDDKGTAVHDGELPWISKGQTLPDFEKAAYALEVGQMSKPILSPAGYHIIKLIDKGNFFPYDSVHADILRFIEQRNIRESIIDNKLAEMAKAVGDDATPAQLLEQRAEEMSEKDSDLKYLIQEYHDGLMLYEISNQKVWKKAADDEAGLAKYFKKNKKKYAWDTPRFKGIAYRTREAADVKEVQKVLKGLPFDQWADKLRSTFNNDSILRIRVEKGIFKQGDNPIVDRDVFKLSKEVPANSEYPNQAVFGKKLKAPKDYQDVRGLVLADYQEQLEKEWVAALRSRYVVTVNQEVLKTVNKH